MPGVEWQAYSHGACTLTAFSYVCSYDFFFLVVFSVSLFVSWGVDWRGGGVMEDTHLCC